MYLQAEILCRDIDYDFFSPEKRLSSPEMTGFVATVSEMQSAARVEESAPLPPKTMRQITLLVMLANNLPPNFHQRAK